MASLDTQIVISATDATQGAFASAQGALAKLSQAASGLGAGLSVGVFASWAKGLIDSADSINDLSQKIGISVKDLGGWQLAAESSGASLETIGKGIKGLSPSIVKFSKEFEALGISTKEPNQAMIDLADVFKDMPDGFEKNALAVKLFGKAGADLVPMLNMGSQGLAASREKAKDYAEQLAKLAPLADEFNDALKVLELRSKARSFSLLTTEVKGATGFIEFLGDATSGVNGFRKAMDFLANDIPKWFGPITLLAGGLKRIADGFARLKEGQAVGAPADLIKPGIPIRDPQKGPEKAVVPAIDPAVKANQAKGSALLKLFGGAGGSAKEEKYKDPLAEFRKKMHKATEDGEKELRDFEFKTREGVEKINEATMELGLPPDMAERFKALAEIDREFEKTKKKIEETFRDIDAATRNVMLEDAAAIRDKDKTDTLAALDKKQEKSHFVKFTEDSRDFSKSLEDVARQYQEQIALVGLSTQEQDRLTIARNATRAAEEKISAAQRAQTPYTLEEQAQFRKSAEESTQQILASIEKRKAAEASWSNGATAGLKNYADSVSNVARSTEALITKAFTGMEDALVKFVQTGKLNFTDMANSIVADLIRIQVQQSVTKPLADLLGGKGGGLDASLFGAIGDFFIPKFSFASGTDYVPFDMIAQIHKGERIVPAAENVPGDFAGSGASINFSTSIDARGADAGVIPQINAALAALEQRVYRAVPGLISRQQLRNRITPMGA